MTDFEGLMHASYWQRMHGQLEHELAAQQRELKSLTKSYENTIERLRSRITELEAELEKTKLRVIEATNPGIDMDEVRASRA